MLLAQDNSSAVRAQRLERRSISLSAVGRREEALTVAREAAGLYGQLDQANPDAFRPDLASSLASLASILKTPVNRRRPSIVAVKL